MNMSRIGCETKFRNTEKEYVPKGMRYVPEGMRYVPKGMRYVPEGMRYVPKGSRAHVNEGEAAVEGRSGDWGEVVTR